MQGVLNNQSLIYEQIAKLIEDGILSGDYTDNEQVPSTNEISRVFNINPATAAKGINRLVDAGLLYKKRGLGMFVQKGASDVLRNNRRASFTKESFEPVLREAKKLGFSEDELKAMIAKYMKEE